jgi:hypothetical protein
MGSDQAAAAQLRRAAGRPMDGSQDGHRGHNCPCSTSQPPPVAQLVGGHSRAARRDTAGRARCCTARLERSGFLAPPPRGPSSPRCLSRPRRVTAGSPAGWPAAGDGWVGAAVPAAARQGEDLGRVGQASDDRRGIAEVGNSQPRSSSAETRHRADGSNHDHCPRPGAVAATPGKVNDTGTHSLWTRIRCRALLLLYQALLRSDSVACVSSTAWLPESIAPNLSD